MKASIDFDLDSHYTKELESLLTTDADFSKRLDEMIWAALGKARERLQNAALAGIKNGDPRQSVRSIKRAVYKKIRGGAISILDGRGRSAGSRATQFRATGQSRRTQQINSYTGADRAFILRFLNSGTGDRVGGYGRNYKMDGNTLYSHKGKPGWRGRIKPAIFMQQRYMDAAVVYLEAAIEEYLTKNTTK